MKRILIAFACGLPFILHAQTSAPYMQKSFPRDAVHRLEAQTSGGNISVSAEPGDARVEVYIRSNNGREISKEEIQQRLNEQFDLTVGLEGGVLKAVAKHKLRDINWNKSLSISFVIHSPSAVSSSLKTSGGNIDLNGLSGNEDFKTSGGNLSLAGLSGKITGRTSGGNVSIDNSKDNIDLQTSGGNMSAKHCEGTIRLETSGGNLDITDIKGSIKATTSGGHVGGSNVAGELQARTSGGNIDFDNMTGSLAASTSGGNIHVIINPAKFIDLSNSGGNITLELPKDKGMDLNISGDQVHSTAMTNFRGDVDKHRISGSLNGGGIPVKVDGNGGSVHLSFR
ncbi:MAG: hypothetical protein JST42_05530 [Bacteroidetes bacterium]|nr:hypothetical protein [Bacteroidota bacterium]